MIPSAEYRAIKALNPPREPVTGDMWLCERLGIVTVYTAHSRGSRKVTRNTFHLYHWGNPSLAHKPATWRDNDSNGGGCDPIKSDHESWRYIGNIFDMLPYPELLRLVPEKV